MAYQQLVAPAIEPIALADAKQHLNVDTGDDDALIAMLIAAARQYAEQLTRSSFITQQWSLVLDRFPGCAVSLEHGPVQSIDSITYLDMGGALQTVPSESYVSDMSGLLARVTPRFGQIWPATLPQIGAVTVSFTAGYGATADKVPAGLVHWIKMRVATLYEHREEVVSARGVNVTPLAFVDGLLDPYRLVMV